MSTFPMTIESINGNPKLGVQISGISALERCGRTISGIGDFNGDSINDVAIGTYSSSGIDRTYIVYGGGLPNVIDLNNIVGDNTKGFILTGFDGAGRVTGIGDVNGDLLGDILITDRRTMWIVYGNTGLNNLDVKTLNNSQGFKINSNGRANGAGDVNGDGIDDIVVCDYGNTGFIGFIIYGSKNISSDSVDLYSKNGTKEIVGLANSVSCSFINKAGDVNGDGIDDIIIGAEAASPFFRTNAGESYVLYGNKMGLSDIDLMSLNNQQGFKIFGGRVDDYTGASVGKAGDINSDGFDDIIIAHKYQQGIGHVIYGRNTTLLTNVDLYQPITSDKGFTISRNSKPQYSDTRGMNVGYAGDFNNDGIDDLVIGIREYSSFSGGDSSFSGEIYVIYGNKNGLDNIDLDKFNLSQGLKIISNGLLVDVGLGGETDNGGSASNIGDINGDGFDDIIIGADTFSINTNFNTNYGAGAAFIIYGANTSLSSPLPTPMPTSPSTGSATGSGTTPPSPVTNPLPVPSTSGSESFSPSPAPMTPSPVTNSLPSHSTSDSESLLSSHTFELVTIIGTTIIAEFLL